MFRAKMKSLTHKRPKDVDYQMVKPHAKKKISEGMKAPDKTL